MDRINGSEQKIAEIFLGMVHTIPKPDKKINKKISLDIRQEIVLMMYRVTSGNSPKHPTLHQNYPH
jgi:hypothetical protein